MLAKMAWKGDVLKTFEQNLYTTFVLSKSKEGFKLLALKLDQMIKHFINERFWWQNNPF